MDFLDLLVIHFIVNRTRMDPKKVERIYLAGKPWVTTDYCEKVAKEAVGLGLDPNTVLFTEADLINKQTDEILSSKLLPDPDQIPAISKIFFRKAETVSKQTNETVQDCLDILMGVGDYQDLVIKKVLN